MKAPNAIYYYFCVLSSNMKKSQLLFCDVGQVLGKGKHKKMRSNLTALLLIDIS
ncbi:hypothetical protein AC062_0058 [Pasteurellaceae bacterium NI1060]|nr:hypothetical protein AC062_0058 [Pasteurellaceae bacterium NI1060]